MRPRRPWTVLATAAAAMVIGLAAVPASTADDGREPGAVPGPAVPAAEPVGPVETGPDSDDPSALPVAAANDAPAAVLDAGRLPGAAPATTDPAEGDAGPSDRGDDDRDDPTARPTGAAPSPAGPPPVDDGRG